MKLVTLMICTYKRKDELKRTLDSIFKMNFDLSKITLIIVENNKKAECLEVVEEYKDKIDIIYSIEEKSGISYARNKCLEIAKTINSKYVAFIDDDEIVSSNWIVELIKVMKTSNADIVSGPVFRIYPKNTPRWIIKSKVFEPANLEDMIELDKCGSGNVLMKKEVINNIEFDKKYGLSGGEDTKFFMELKKKGKKIVYSKHGIAFEYLEDNRVNYKYLAKRIFRESSYYVHIEEEVLGVNTFKRLIKSILKIVISFIIIPFSVFGGIKNIIKTVNRIIMGCGEIYGLLSKKLIKGY